MDHEGGGGTAAPGSASADVLPPWRSAASANAYIGLAEWQPLGSARGCGGVAGPALSGESPESASWLPGAELVEDWSQPPLRRGCLGGVLCSKALGSLGLPGVPMVKTGAEGAPGEAGATNGPEDGPVEVKAGEAGGSAPKGFGAEAPGVAKGGLGSGLEGALPNVYVGAAGEGGGGWAFGAYGTPAAASSPNTYFGIMGAAVVE